MSKDPVPFEIPGKGDAWEHLAEDLFGTAAARPKDAVAPEDLPLDEFLGGPAKSPAPPTVPPPPAVPPASPVPTIAAKPVTAPAGAAQPVAGITEADLDFEADLPPAPTPGGAAAPRPEPVRAAEPPRPPREAAPPARREPPVAPPSETPEPVAEVAPRSEEEGEKDDYWSRLQDWDWDESGTGAPPAHASGDGGREARGGRRGRDDRRGGRDRGRGGERHEQPASPGRSESRDEARERRPRRDERPAQRAEESPAAPPAAEPRPTRAEREETVERIRAERRQRPRTGEGAGSAPPEPRTVRVPKPRLVEDEGFGSGLWEEVGPSEPEDDFASATDMSEDDFAAATDETVVFAEEVEADTTDVKRLEREPRGEGDESGRRRRRRRPRRRREDEPHGDDVRTLGGPADEESEPEPVPLPARSGGPRPRDERGERPAGRSRPAAAASAPSAPARPLRPPRDVDDEFGFGSGLDEAALDDEEAVGDVDESGEEGGAEAYDEGERPRRRRRRRRRSRGEPSTVRPGASDEADASLPTEEEAEDEFDVEVDDRASLAAYGHADDGFVEEAGAGLEDGEEGPIPTWEEAISYLVNPRYGEGPGRGGDGGEPSSSASGEGGPRGPRRGRRPRRRP